MMKIDEKCLLLILQTWKLSMDNTVPPQISIQLNFGGVSFLSACFPFYGILLRSFLSFAADVLVREECILS